MAVIASKSDVVQGGKNRIPKDRYRVRITGAKHGLSSGGGKTGEKYPMTTLDLEIIEPESIIVDGETFSIAGRPFQLYLMCVPDKQWGMARVFEFMDKLQIPYGEQYDTDLVKDYFVGREFDMILDSEEQIKRKAPQAGQKLGDPILDGEGKVISDGYRINAQMDGVPANCRPFHNTNIAF